MQLDHHTPTARFNIQAFTDDSITINNEVYRQPIIISKDSIKQSPVESIKDLTKEHIQPLVAEHPELVLIGSGPDMQPLKPELIGLFLEQGIGVEVMNTPSALRTYTLLANDGRAVTAVIF